MTRALRSRLFCPFPIACRHRACYTRSAFGVRRRSQDIGNSVRSRGPKTSISFRTFVFFVTFCSNSLRSLLFHLFPIRTPPLICAFGVQRWARAERIGVSALKAKPLSISVPSFALVAFCSNSLRSLLFHLFPNRTLPLIMRVRRSAFLAPRLFGFLASSPRPPPQTPGLQELPDNQPRNPQSQFPGASKQ